MSHDQGQTWSKSLDVGAQQGVQNSVLPAVVAGDDNRAAFAFLGTTTSGNFQSQLNSFAAQGDYDVYLTAAAIDTTGTDDYNVVGHSYCS